MKQLAAGCAAALPVLALAGPPVGYGQWSVTNGVIDTASSCQASGVSCTTITEGLGILQEEVTTASGRFVRMILTETNADGSPAQLAFSTESFTPFFDAADPRCQGPAAQDCQGIASIQTVQDAAANFASTVQLQRNFAKSNETTTAAMFNIDVLQTLSDPVIDTRFALRNYTEWEFFSPDTVIGRVMDIAQQTLTGDIAAGDTTTKQKFDYRLRGGWQGRMANNPWQPSISAPITPAGQMDAPLGGTLISWNDAEEISTLWLASNKFINLNFQAVENKTAGTRAQALTREPLSTGVTLQPMSWNAVFGTPPAFP